MRKSIVSSLSLTPETWARTQELMKLEKKNRSEVVCEAVSKYYTMKQWQELQAKGVRAAKKLGIINESDVQEMIHGYRKKK